MPSKKPLPEIKACPKPGCTGFYEVRVEGNDDGTKNWWVQCQCGWKGPPRSTERAAIVIWGKRSDEAAERRGAMAVVGWFRKDGCLQIADTLAAAIERGEVVGKRGRR